MPWPDKLHNDIDAARFMEQGLLVLAMIPVVTLIFYRPEAHHPTALIVSVFAIMGLSHWMRLRVRAARRTLEQVAPEPPTLLGAR